jgi:predicted O-linked N-acetylglucosamine transferase (SPINDLY family)
MTVDTLLRSAVEHYQKGNLRQAEDICRKILQKQPKNFHVLNFLGAIYYQREEFDSASRYFKKALQINPGFAEAYNNLGNALKGRDQLDEAIACYRKAVELSTSFDLAYNGLGVALQKKGNIDDAIDSFRKALQINPNYADAYNNLGTAFREKGSLDDAIAFFEKALQINPNIADVYNNLGTAFREKGNLDGAIAFFEKALQVNPAFAGALYNLGNVFEEKAQYDSAITCYQEALRMEPNNAETYNNLGNAYKGKWFIDEAIICYHRAIQLNPNYAEAYNNLGLALQDQGKPEEAEKYYRDALQMKPDFASCFSNLLLLMNYNPRHDAQSIFAGHLRFSKQIAEPLYPAALHHGNDRSPARRLRIGYVSPDFRRHSVNYFIEPVLASHRHDQFEVFCYSDVLRPDTATERLKEYADQWRNIVGISDEKVSELVRRDEIDILVDLAGHTGYNRMLLFARKPAPVQVSWLGYPNTTGLSTMDYRIVDSHTDPPGLTDPFYTEKLIRMPESFLCYHPDKGSPAAGDLPALKSRSVTFGSFNVFPKISSETTALWAAVLKALPDSCLIMKTRNFTDRTACKNAVEMFVAYGISPERIELVSYKPSFTDHLAMYNRIDIGLDTFPYNGTTTTCEAAWMGVPVITLAGNTHASRVGMSLLTNIGLPELISGTYEEYLATAVNLAGDLARLGSLREKLRHMMEHSPLTDAKRFTVNLEGLYRKMWERWCTEWTSINHYN